MNLTIRILLILAIALVPAVGVQVYNAYDLRRARERQVREEALRQAELLNANLGGLISGADQVGAGIAGLLSVRTLDPACGADLEGVRQRLGRYKVITLWDASGRPVCSTPAASDSLAPPPELARVLATGVSAIGRYTAGTHPGEAHLPLVVPLKVDGTVRGAIVFGLGVDTIAQRMSAAKPSGQSTVVVADRNGTILARHPDNEAYVGRSFPPSLKGLLDAPAPGNAVVPGYDGRDRLIGYFPPAAPPEGLWVSVGFFLPELTADIRGAGYRSLALSGLAVFCATVLALLLGSYVIRRPTEALIAAARRWSAGDLSSRAPVRHAHDEFAQLGAAFNAMADSLERREAALRESEERNRLAIAATGLGTWHADFVASRQTWSDEIRRMAGLPPDVEARPSVLKPLFEPPDWERLKAAFAAAADPARDEPLRIEVPIRRADDGRQRWMLVIGRVIFDARRRSILRAVAVVIDVTERRRAEEHQRLLLHELNHRVKNTLATVQAIALQTLRQTRDPAAFAESFQARLLSLSGTHNLLTESAWQNASLRSLLETELAPYLRPEGGRARLDGEIVALPARQALALGMVIHELTTNAAKYGALSVPEGRVEVSWAVSGHAPERGLMVHWRERGGPRVAEPAKAGFGSRLIRRTVEDELGGRVVLEHRPEGVTCAILIPLAEGRPEAAGERLAAE